MTTDSLSIIIGDADLVTTDNYENFSYILGDLTAYTEYSFNLSSVYGNAISDVVSASGTTSEASKISKVNEIFYTTHDYSLKNVHNGGRREIKHLMLTLRNHYNIVLASL